MPNRLRPLVAGNWKMNGLRRGLVEIAGLCAAVADGAAGAAEIVICPPATLLMKAAEICAGSLVRLGGQDCHVAPRGAFTGDVSAEMLRDAGAAYVILGHSERRTAHGETDERVRLKAAAALTAGLSPIVCVGESHAERRAGRTLAVVLAQLAGSLPEGVAGEDLIIAYEPVWAIGTGLTPTPGDIAEVHGALRHGLEGLLPGHAAEVRILYGGSVKPGNAAELMKVADVDGALVGGASLVCADFLAIASVYREAAL